MANVKLVLGIEIDGNKLLLSEEAAKELYRKLKEIFEDKKGITYIPFPYPVYPVQPVWVNPIYVTPTPVITQPIPVWYGYDVNTCVGVGGNISSSDYISSNF